MKPALRVATHAKRRRGGVERRQLEELKGGARGVSGLKPRVGGDKRTPGDKVLKE